MKSSIENGYCKLAPLWLQENNQKNVRNPQPPLLLEKYRNTPPICIAIRLQFVLQCFRCPSALRKGKPKGPFRTVFSTESDSVVFYYSVVNLLRIVIHY